MIGTVMKRKEKGTFGYIKWQQIYTIVRTLLLFVLALGLYFAGYITTGTNRNLLTIIAVLGLLPAAKSMVNMIMFLRFRSLKPDIYEQFESKRLQLAVLYENILTTKEQAYDLPMIAYRNHTLCGFCPRSGDLKALETHIRECLKTELPEVSVKIFSDQRIFLDRIAQMNEMDQDASDTKDTERVFAVIKAVSL